MDFRFPIFHQPVETMPELLFLLLIVPPLTGYVARSRGRSFWGWFALACILPIVSYAIVIFLSDKSTHKE